MTNEQREAIEDLDEIVNLSNEELQKEEKNVTAILAYEDLRSLDTVLSLIKEQEKKIEKTDKIIDKISQNPFNELRVKGIRFCGGDIKQYFADLVEKE